MIVIPYTHRSHAISPLLTLTTIQILCEGGQSPWKEDDQSIKNVLEPNDIITNVVQRVDNTYYVNVDTEKTDMNSMYTWNEIPSTDKDTLCWRSFYVMTNTDKTLWLPLTESSLTPYLRVILKTSCGISI